MSGTDLRQYLAGYLGRTALGLGLALVAAGLGVILARMGLLLFGVTSWVGWLAMLLGGIGLGAGLGSATAWLWLKGMGNRFSSFLALVAVTAGMGGAWLAFRYGTGSGTRMLRLARYGAARLCRYRGSHFGQPGDPGLRRHRPDDGSNPAAA